MSRTSSKSILYVISGPSGCGKSTLARRILDRFENVRFSVSHTTRPRRESEVEARDYYFVNPRTFKKMIRDRKFAEWAVVHGSYYGTSRAEIGKKEGKADLLLDIDVQGARKIRRRYKKAVLVFVVPPHFRALKKRLEARGEDSPGEIAKRLSIARREVREYRLFDYIVINDDLEKATEELEAVVLSRRCRLGARKSALRPILQSFRER